MTFEYAVAVILKPKKLVDKSGTSLSNFIKDREPSLYKSNRAGGIVFESYEPIIKSISPWTVTFIVWF